MAKDYTYDKNTKTYTYKNGDVSIHHISEKMFEVVCKKFVKSFGLTYVPADWEWQCYPDIGYANLHDVGWRRNVTWGYSRYTKYKDGRSKTESIIRTDYMTRTGKRVSHDYIVDTKEQLVALLERFFKVTLKITP